MYVLNSSIPCNRCIFPFIKLMMNPNVKTKNIVRSKGLMSVGVLLVIPELINNEILNTKTILIIFDPNMFPKSNPYSFFLAAFNDVANSGNDVPNATAVTPITKSVIPRCFANEVAPSIK